METINLHIPADIEQATGENITDDEENLLK